VTKLAIDVSCNVNTCVLKEVIFNTVEVSFRLRGENIKTLHFLPF
jgi:hypothetical protein